MKVIHLGAIGVNIQHDDREIPGAGGPIARREPYQFRLTLGGNPPSQLPVVLVLNDEIAATIAAALLPKATVAGHFRRNASGDWEQVHVVFDAPADVVTLYHGEFQEQAVEDLGALREQAAAWNKVCDLLREVAPGWADGTGTGQECALAAIRRMVAGTKPTPAPGMAVQCLATEIVEALLADDKDGGYDLTGGMFGAQFSALVRRWAALEYAQALDELAAPPPAAQAQPLPDFSALMKATPISGWGAQSIGLSTAAPAPPPAPPVQRPATGLPLDPNKVQLCRVGTHSAAMEREGQPCDCPPGTCRLWKGGLRAPDAPNMIAVPHFKCATCGCPWVKNADGAFVSYAKRCPACSEGPPDTELVEAGVEVTPSDFGAWLDAGGERRGTPR